MKYQPGQKPEYFKVRCAYSTSILNWFSKYFPIKNPNMCPSLTDTTWPMMGSRFVHLILVHWPSGGSNAPSHAVMCQQTQGRRWLQANHRFKQIQKTVLCTCFIGKEMNSFHNNNVKHISEFQKWFQVMKAGVQFFLSIFGDKYLNEAAARLQE